MKYENYITAINSSDNKEKYSFLKILIEQDKIIITTTFAKQMRINSSEIISENTDIHKNYHTTRHKTFFHNTTYVDGKPINSIYEEDDCQNLLNLDTYEVIGCYEISPFIGENMSYKIYQKSSEKEIATINNIACNYYIYIIVSPKEMYELEKFFNEPNIVGFSKSYGDFPFKIYYLFEMNGRLGGPNLSNCIGMYRKCHPNNGCGEFISMNEIIYPKA